MTMKKQLTALMIVAFAVGISAPTAHAGLSMILDSGTTQITVQDNVGLDVNPLVGVLTFSGPIDGWGINVTTGISKPVIGGPAEAKIDLNSVNVTTQGPGTLTLMLTDTDFSLPEDVGAQAVLTSRIGGTTNGILTLTQILDRENNEFAEDSLDVVSLVSGPFGPGAFSSTLAAVAPVSDLFSLTEVVVITHRGAGITSFDAESTVVPVPGAILLGFLGVGAAGLKLRRFA